jgi:hypothetical protein
VADRDELVVAVGDADIVGAVPVPHALEVRRERALT